MGKFLNFMVVGPDLFAERIGDDDIDPGELSGVIDRTLLPVVGGAQGWALNRQSGYYVIGDIGSKRAWLTLLDGPTPVAVLGVCLHSRAASGLWADLVEKYPLLANWEKPSHPWAVFGSAPDTLLPFWAEVWAKTTAWALVTRTGW